MTRAKAKLSAAAVEMYNSIDWPALWREFASELNTWGYPKYLGADHLCRAKFGNDGAKQKTLLTMIGPGVTAEVRTWARKHGFRWVDSWDEKRTLYWSSTELLQQLAAERNKGEFRLLLTRLRRDAAEQILRAEKISKATIIAYAGQPFLPDLAPTAPRNVYRARKYLQALGEAFDLFHRAAMVLSRGALIEVALDGHLTPFAVTSLSPQADTLLLAGQLAALETYKERLIAKEQERKIKEVKR